MSHGLAVYIWGGYSQQSGMSADAQGCSLLALHHSTLWKHVMLSGGDFLRGRLGVARLPGSELVEDPSTGALFAP